MLLAELKPIAATLLLPPAGPLLLALLAILLLPRLRRVGALLATAGLLALWLASCNAVAVALHGWLLPPAAPLQPAQLQAAQAIVVLGGGVRPVAPEYGTPQPATHTLGRLRYGARLARASGLPLAFAGGVGWSARGTTTVDEAQVAQRVLQEDYGITPRWLDAASRDTAENARQLAAQLLPHGVRRIVLVTDAWHVPRARLQFERAGFEVLPAPTGFAGWRERPLLEWLPSAHGLESTRQALREWLALQLARRAATD